MTNIFDQEGITFLSAKLASTAPSTNADPIKVPHIDMGNAPANQIIPQVSASELLPITKTQNSGASIPPPPAHQQISSLAGMGDDGAAAAGAAPPQPQAANIFDQEGITFAPSVTSPAFSRGVTVSPNATPTPETEPVLQYAQHQQQQTYQLAQQRFTPQQLQDFASNPISITEAIQNQQDWPDVPALLQKQRDGVPMDNNQKNRLNDYIDTQLQTNMRGMSWGGSKAIVGYPLPATAQDYVNSGDGAKSAPDAQNAPSPPPRVCNVVIPTPYSPKAGETPLNDYMAVTDKGQQVIASAKTKPATTALKLLSFDELPHDLQTSFYDSLTIHDPSAKITDLMTQQGYHKAVDTLGEDNSSQLLSVRNGTAANSFDHYVQEAGRDAIQGGTFFIPYTLATRIYDIPLNLVQLGVGASLNNSSLARSGANAIQGTFLDNPKIAQFFQDHPRMPTFGDLYEKIGEELFPGGAPESKTAQYVDTGVAMAAGGAGVKAANAGAKLLNAVIGAGVGVGGQFSGEKAQEWAQDNFPNNQPLQELIGQTASLISMIGIGAAGHVASKPFMAKPGEAPTLDQHLNAITPDKDQAMVNAGVVSVDGAKSAATVAAETILKDKGLPPDIAEETVANMTATMKDNFVQKHQQLPQSEFPTLSDKTATAKADAEQAQTNIDWHNQQLKDLDREYLAAEAKNDGAKVDAVLKQVQEHRDAIKQEQAIIDAQKPGASGQLSVSLGGDGKLLADEPPGSSTGADIIKADTKATQSQNPSYIPNQESGFNAFFSRFKSSKERGYSEMWNDLQPIEDLGTLAKERGAPITKAELSPAALSLAKSTPALIERQWTTNTTTWDNEGRQRVTGNGLKQISDDFDRMFMNDEKDVKTRHQDMSDFRKAMTFLEDKKKDLSPVSAKDLADSHATLTRLADKYGEKLKWFETFAKQFVDWDRRILYNLVTSGLKSQEWYDDLTGKREWYAPTSRVVETEFPEDVKPITGTLGQDVNPSNIGALKQRKGSELEVQDPIISSMRNSAIIIRRAMLNKIRGDAAKYAEYFPEKVTVKPPALIREAVQHSYDPKLREKLTQLVQFLGGEVKRVEKIDGAKRGTLGTYDTNSGDVFVRHGTTEGTLTHEAGHKLDYLLGLKDRLLNNNEHPEIRAELQKLAEDRLRAEIKLQKTPEGMTEFAEKMERAPKSYMKYLKNDDEVIANFFDAWVNSPEQVAETAPHAKAAFEKMIDEKPQLAMLRNIRPSTSRAMETIQRELLDYKGPENSLPFYKNGRLLFLHMQPDIAKAFKGLDQVQSTMVGGFISKIGKAQAKMLQFGATNNPYFIARHFFRGAQSSYVNTPLKEGPMGFFRHFAIEIPKGIAAVIGKTSAFREWASSSGALRTYMDTSTEGLSKMHEQIFESSDYSKFLNPKNWAEIAKDGLVGGWQTAKQVSDYAPRIAAYERLIKAGYPEMEAGYLSLEATGNYIRHGSLGKEINAFSPFFNDRLQGADRFLRAVKRDPAGYSMKAMALITMPQLLVSGYYLFAADEDTRNEYLNLNDFRRSTAMNIKIGGHWIPFPRAFAPGFVFGALPEFAMIHFSGVAHPELKNFWLHMITDTISSLSPSTDWTQTIPPLIKAAIEGKSNYNFFRDQPIFHGDINKTAPEDQFNQSTSETAKALGKLFGISPADIDNTAYDMAAHIGVYAEQLGDYAINSYRRAEGLAVNEKPTRGSDNPLYGPMMQPDPVGTSGKSYQVFLENMHNAEQMHNHFKNLEGDEADAYQKQNEGVLDAYDDLHQSNIQINSFLKQIRGITKDASLTGDEKAAQIKDIQKDVQTTLEDANKTYLDATGGQQ